MAELMLGQPLFPGESGIDQLVEIIKVLGTPTREQIRTMNPNYMEHKFPQIKPHPFSKVFRKADANAIDLISKLLEYTPTERLSAIEAMVHPFFDELRDPNTKLPDSRHQTGQVRELPVMFDFTKHGTFASSGRDNAYPVPLYSVLTMIRVQSCRLRRTSTTSWYRRIYARRWRRVDWISITSHR